MNGEMRETYLLRDECGILLAHSRLSWRATLRRAQELANERGRDVYVYSQTTSFSILTYETTVFPQ